MFENLNPMDRPTAIMEILIMLIVAFIIGFIIAWLLRKNKKEVVTQTVDNSDEINALRNRLRQAEDANIKLKEDMGKVQVDLDECLASKTKVVEMSSVIEEEIDSLPLAGAVESDKENAEKLGFEVASASDKDDLTKIKGVGPFIEKKLNGLGIYTFKQISGFTDDTIEKVTEAIEFFPGRIQRDNWVTQAGELNEKKS